MVEIIAEIGNTHEGSIGLAKKFIDSAYESGANTVKFQTHIFETESLPNAPNPPYFANETRKEYFERTAFTGEQYKELIRYSVENYGLKFISSPFSHEAVDLLIEAGVDRLKIPSGEVSNIPLLEYIATKKVKVILSSGMSSWEELDRAVHVLKKGGELTILQCTSEYPCPPEKAGLNIMLEMKKRYGLSVGLSDHTSGVGVPIAAVALGAEIIEKHFTLSNKMYGSDAMNSMEPNEFKAMSEAIRQAEIAISAELKKDSILKELGTMKKVFEKSIVSRRNILPGEIISIQDIAFKKPGDGIPAWKYNEIIGKKVIKVIPENTMIDSNFLS